MLLDQANGVFFSAMAAPFNISNGRLACPILPFLQVNATEPDQVLFKSSTKDGVAQKMRPLCRSPRLVFDYLRMSLNSASASAR